VQVYQAKNDLNIIHASQCASCFTIFYVNDDYHIFIAGVDAKADPNPSVQFHNWIDFERKPIY